jgi:alpha-amylase
VERPGRHVPGEPRHRLSTNEDGTPQQGHQFDSFANNWHVEQAYAQILTHPGVSCVYWKHYYDWGSDLQNKIKALINARKVAGSAG